MADAFERFVTTTRARIGSDALPWLADVQRLIDELSERWELSIGEPLPGGVIGYTVGAVRGGATPVVLKISYPDGWFAEETAALVHWDGNGAIELIDHDPRGAQLLERAEPGTSLLEMADEDAALGLAADQLERLWIPDPGGITSLASEVARWASTMAARHDEQGPPFERALVHEAVGLIRDLSPRQHEQVLLHGDLHLGNVLAAEREPWLVIDPKPLIGEREFDAIALVRDKGEELAAEPEAGGERVQRRFDLLCERLQLDRGRVKGWAVAVAIDYALWDFEVGDHQTGEQEIAVARLLRGLRA
jgi:streptomycin 6-kinase